MICSRLASAVTISTGRVLSLGSARTALSSSMPVITGMFQSVTMKSNGWLCSSDSAACPSSASAVLVKPRSPSRFLTMRRMVEKSSTIRIRMFLFKRCSSSWFVEAGVGRLENLQPAAQAQHGLAVDLADARLAHAEHRADLLQVQFLLVVQRQHQLLAFGQHGDGLAQLLAELAAFEHLLRGRAAAGRGVQF